MATEVVNATKVTLIVDEQWMEILANHHSVVQEGEVFSWESSEPVGVIIEKPDPPTYIEIDYYKFDLDPESEFQIEAEVKHGKDRLTAELTYPRDASESVEFFLYDHNGYEADDLDIAGFIQRAMEQRVDAALALIAATRRDAEHNALGTPQVVTL